MSSGRSVSQGKVFLVGGGPGEADLLTVRAARILSTVDVLVYDHLVSDAVLALARPDAEKIYAGKEAGNHSLPQGDINRLLVSLAAQGKQVARLKGGDPFIFGRGGEEVAELVGANICFEVVPGVTAACGAAAFAGIPLTHRDHAQSCLFVTGHLKDGTCELDWPSLARPRQTLVIYMGLGALAEITRQLVAAGMPPDMPSACIRNATLPDQQTVVAPLSQLAQVVHAAGIAPPALLIIGTVVSLHAQLSWFAPQTAD